MQNKENVAETAIPTSEHLALEVLKQEQKKSSARNKGLLAGMILLAIVATTVTIAGSVERANLVKVNYQNDCDWRALFADYDFISQDGGGINNVNGGEQGDLNNGATGENTEGREVEGSSSEENEF